MDLHSELIKSYSIYTNRRIFEWIKDDEDRIRLLVDLFLYGESRIAQRASWIVSGIAERNPQLIEPYLYLIIPRMTDETAHIAVRRNTVRLLQFVNLPEDLKGLILDTCFAFLEDSQNANTIQVFAMTVIANLTNEYPEIAQEFKLILEKNLEHGASPAFKSRANKVLKKLAT